MPRRTLRPGAGLEQQLSGRAVRSVPFDHIERLVDGAADDGVEELERILATEKVEPNEHGGGRTKLACLHAGEGGRVAQLGPVAEDRGRAQKGKRHAAAGERGGARPREKRPAPPISSRWGMCSAVGAGSLPCNRVEHRADEERISAGRRFQRGAEGFVRFQTVQLAREQGDRGTAKRFGANRGGLRIGDELCDERGIAPLSLGGPGSGGDEERDSVEPSRQVEQPPQGGGVGPVQVVDRKQRRLVKGRVGGEPVKAVEDRERTLRRARPGTRRASKHRTSGAISSAGPESSSARRSGAAEASSGSNS